MSKLTTLQTLIDQLTKVHDLWGEELLSLLGVEDTLLVKCFEHQRDYLINQEKATRMGIIKLGNDELYSKLIPEETLSHKSGSSRKSSVDVQINVEFPLSGRAIENELIFD